LASTIRRQLGVASAIAERLPLRLLVALGDHGGRLASRGAGMKFEQLVENLRLVEPWRSDDDLTSLARRGFGSYGRYWAETLRLPTLGIDVIDAGFEVHGYEHLLAAREAGFGPIMVLPHLGGWEWAAAWLGRVAAIPVTAVVERLEPDDVFEWFVQLRQSWGVSVLSLDDRGIFAKLAAAVQAGHVVCLLGDRDLSTNGVDVEFFGRTVSLPIGPAVLSRRTGAPILPTAVFFDGNKRRCVIAEPIWPSGQGKLRDEAAATTQLVATRLEDFIRRAPEQWHVLEPLGL
jgi:lauroyl/myristoyl acyltransferase